MLLVARETLQATSLRLILSCMKLYRCRERFIAEHADQFYDIRASSWDEIIAREGLFHHLSGVISQARRTDEPAPQDLLPPISSQEV